jgi:hypothetical protein
VYFACCVDRLSGVCRERYVVAVDATSHWHEHSVRLLMLSFVVAGAGVFTVIVALVSTTG